MLTFTADIFNIWKFSRICTEITQEQSAESYLRDCLRDLALHVHCKQFGIDEIGIGFYIFLPSFSLPACPFISSSSLYSLNFHISLPFISVLPAHVFTICTCEGTCSCRNMPVCVHWCACDSLLCSRLAACLVVGLSCISNRLRFRGWLRL